MGPEGEHRRGNDVRVNDLNNGTQSETSIARARHGALCAAWNDTGRNVTVNGLSAFGSSRNNGQTWQDGGPFPPGPGPDRNFGDPSLAWSDRDQVFYYGALSDLGLSLWTSNDGCQTFQYVGPIHVHVGANIDDKELIAVDNDKNSPYYGRIYVGWSNFALATDVNQTSYSNDGGLNWSNPVSLPGSGTNGQGMWPAIAPNADVYFALVNRSFVIGGQQDQWSTNRPTGATTGSR